MDKEPSRPFQNFEGFLTYVRLAKTLWDLFKILLDSSGLFQIYLMFPETVPGLLKSSSLVKTYTRVYFKYIKDWGIFETI